MSKRNVLVSPSASATCHPSLREKGAISPLLIRKGPLKVLEDNAVEPPAFPSACLYMWKSRQAVQAKCRYTCVTNKALPKAGGLSSVGEKVSGVGRGGGQAVLARFCTNRLKSGQSLEKKIQIPWNRVFSEVQGVPWQGWKGQIRLKSSPIPRASDPICLAPNLLFLQGRNQHIVINKVERTPSWAHFFSEFGVLVMGFL